MRTSADLLHIAGCSYLAPRSSRMVAAVLLALLSVSPSPAHPSDLQEQVIRRTAGGQKYWVEEVVRGLKFPSAIAWLPDGAALIAERHGGLRFFRNGEVDPKPLTGVPA